MLSISDKIFHTVKQYGMLPPGSTVAVGVSGGADSTALLYWLASHRAELQIQVVAAHVNHGLRGAEADHDETCVRRLCVQLGVSLQALHINVREEARKTGEGIEECGRRLRYAFFYKLCKQYTNPRVATAHTLSDNAETMLLNLARGAGAAGLSGIPPVRGLVVRPLIALTRAETEQYCRENGLAYCTDSTNADDSCMRNWVRLHIVPLFAHIDPRFEQAAGRAACALREDDACLRALAQRALTDATCAGGWRAECLLQQPRAIRLRALYLAAHGAGAGRLSQQHLLELDRLLKTGGGCTLPADCSARVEQGILLFPAAVPGYEVPLRLPETTLPDGRLFSLQVLSKTAYEKEKGKFIFSNCLNYATINTDTLVRTRRPGDSFSPAGRGITKSLKKLLNEKRVPPSLRARLAMLSRGSDILWIEGCGPSEKAKVTPQTQEIAVVTIKECR
ncbi:MAG: tRNA lysidine(34) synthetase TilS [Oscillospiraceae bacterium]|jgi:tRNA(Ile)-lysidine synthase|nr:tRNA lysidine(34) synthetase TilS [Oscillospiraceae bacterium]MDD3261429.1 tRNA lysidine(34) synthetase TilS [Oscillospiraceae bacterium]